MHPAQNRGLRELWAFGTNLERHWTSLAGRLEDDEPAAGLALRAGAAAARRVREAVRPLMARRGLYAETMAEAAGRFVAPRPLPADAPLERNQALRFAVLDGEQVVTLLAYLARLAASDGDAELRALLDDGERDVRAITGRVRSAAVGLGDRPDAAIEPVAPAPAHRIGYAIGAVGEWVDRQIGRRRGRDAG